MKITYAVTVCNELEEIKKLIPHLLEYKRKNDNIVVLFDQKNGKEEVAEYLKTFSKLPNFQFWRGLDFEGHFANWKNKLIDYCDGDYIFQIDADEIPHINLLERLQEVLEGNPDTEVFLVPRVNTVKGLTQEHIQKWRWNVNEKEWVNWPDWQWRIWKNKPEIRWVNKVHERLNGFKTYAPLPEYESFSLRHDKTITKQEKQNAYYDTLT